MKRNLEKILERPWFFIFIASYALLTSYIYLNHQALVYDEAWFLSIPYEFKNILGYGNLYWLFLHLIPSPLILRILALFSMLGVGILIFLFARFFYRTSECDPYAIVLLWLSFPAAWWYGKLISADLYGLFLGFLGLYLALTKGSFYKRAGIVLLGLSIGIKVSFVVLAVFYCFYIFFNDISKESYKFKKAALEVFFKKYFGLIGLLSFGFLLGSPSFIFAPSAYLQTIQYYSSERFNLLFKRFLFDSTVDHFWETVLNPSFSYFTLSKYSLMLLLTFFLLKKVLVKDWKLCGAFLFSFLLNFFLIAKAYRYFVWFWYPSIILIPLFFLSFEIKKKWLYVLISINFLANGGVTLAQILDKLNQINLTKNIEAVKWCAKEKLKSSNLQLMEALLPPKGRDIVHINYLTWKREWSQPASDLFLSPLMMINYSRRDNVYGYLFERYLVGHFFGVFLGRLHDLPQGKYEVQVVGGCPSGTFLIKVNENNK